jgi:Asp/Glu/hydantoin racemase
MSWESTAEYYRFVNEAVRQRLGGLHWPTACCAPLTWPTWSTCTAPRGGTTPARCWRGEARELVAAGAGLIVLCPNTMHKVADAITEAIDVPFLHIADTTAAAVREAGVSTVGLLATGYTMEQDFYVGRLRDRHGLQVARSGRAGSSPDPPRHLGRALRRRRRGPLAQCVPGGSCAAAPRSTSWSDPTTHLCRLLHPTRLHAERAVDMALEPSEPVATP